VLTIARDAFGKKPLYYTERNGRFSFASEQKALIRAGCVSPELSRTALGEYLRFYSVPHPYSITENVAVLPPGSILRLGATGAIQLERWYELPEYHPANISFEDAV